MLSFETDFTKVKLSLKWISWKIQIDPIVFNANVWSCFEMKEKNTSSTHSASETNFQYADIIKSFILQPTFHDSIKYNKHKILKLK